MLRLRSGSAIALITLVLAGSARGATARLPPLPAKWPHSLQIGVADDPNGAAALRKVAPFGFRYQYLAGGVNTGGGWATWNPNGTFASMYVHDSWAHGQLPVLTLLHASAVEARRRR